MLSTARSLLSGSSQVGTRLVHMGKSHEKRMVWSLGVEPPPNQVVSKFSDKTLMLMKASNATQVTASIDRCIYGLSPWRAHRRSIHETNWRIHWGWKDQDDTLCFWTHGSWYMLTAGLSIKQFENHWWLAGVDEFVRWEWEGVISILSRSLLMYNLYI